MSKKLNTKEYKMSVSKKYRGVVINKITGESFWTHKKVTYKDAYDSAVRLAKRKTVYDNCTITSHVYTTQPMFFCIEIAM